MDQRPIRVLYVDDDEHDFVLTRELLSRVYGGRFAVDWAPTYAEGAEALRSPRHDVALVDYRLGPDDGLALIREAVAAGCETPLILLTGRDDRAADVAAAEAGAADYLVKGRTDARTLERAIRYAARQKRTEAELRRSEAHYRLLFESVPHPMFACDNATLAILDVNPEAVRQYGYTREEFLRMSMVDLRPPEEVPKFLAWVEANRERPPVDAGCWRHRRKDGSVVEMEVVVNVLPGASGVTRVAIARDVTEQRRSGEAVRRSERQLRAVFDGALDAMVIADDEGRYTDANRAACVLFGLPRERLVGRKVTDFMPADEARAADECWQEFLTGGGFRRSNRLVRADGSVRDVESSVTARVLPGRHLSVVRDVTERNRMEEALRESEERFRGAFAAAAAGMAIVAPDGRFVDVNRSLCHITGYSEDELLRRTFQDITHPDDLAGDLTLLRQLLDGETPSYQLEKRYIHKQGHVVWVMLSVSLVHDAQGRPLHGVALIEDITPRKQAEAQRARLLRQVKRARRRLAALSERLIAAQEAERRHLARELHDEIGQSLTALKLIVQAVPAAPDAAERDAFVDEGRQIVDRLIGQVRDLSLDLRPSMLDDLGLVPALRWYVGRLAQRTGLGTRFSADAPRPPAPPAVETACFRIAQEALTNVCRHASARHVWVELGGRDGELWLTVRDDGTGFDPAAVRDQVARGTGLGLLGMRERAALLGGRIDITSGPGQGTTVRAAFPLARG